MTKASVAPATAIDLLLANLETLETRRVIDGPARLSISAEFRLGMNSGTT